MSQTTNIQQPSFVSMLLSSIPLRFEAAKKDYNEVLKLTEKLQIQYNETANKNAVILAYRTTLLNRYEAVKNLDTLRERASQGFQWGWFFAMNRNLETDIRDSGKIWLANKIWPSWSFLSIVQAMKAMPSVAVTAAFTTQADVERLKKVSTDRIKQEMQGLAFSTAASLSIGQTLKYVGSFAKTEGTQLLAKSVRGTWTLSSVLAFAYGLGKINDAMSSTDNFDGPLRLKRDAFNAGQKEKYAEYIEHLAEGFEDF